jgi:hypothetical protein
VPSIELLGLAALGVAFWLWYDNLKAREAGVRASRAACAAESLQFLDDTVTLASLRPRRDEHGRLKLRRVYRFEFSDTGNNRRGGAVTLLGNEVQVLRLERPDPSLCMAEVPTACPSGRCRNC